MNKLGDRLNREILAELEPGVRVVNPQELLVDGHPSWVFHLVVNDGATVSPQMKRSCHAQVRKQIYRHRDAFPDMTLRPVPVNVREDGHLEMTEIDAIVVVTPDVAHLLQTVKRTTLLKFIGVFLAFLASAYALVIIMK